MSLYERFKDEAEFQDKFVKPLLNRLGFYGVSHEHGSQEFGKDFVFSELHRLGGMRHYAAQAKHEEKISQGKSVDELLSQVRQAFARPFRRTDSPRDCYVSAVYVLNSGDITANAKEQLLDDLGRERYGDNVHFLDGGRLESLNEWAALQSDTYASGAAGWPPFGLRAIIFDLKEYRTQGKESLTPMFVHGIEMYLSEPVNCDDQLLAMLLKLWQFLHGIETLQAYRANIRTCADAVAKHNRARGKGLPLVVEACRKVDSALDKMKPLESS